MRSQRLACAVLLALLATGCAAAARGFRCPAHGGPGWRELVSDHFVLRTDLPRDRAARLIGDLERLRAALASVLLDPGGAAGRVEVIAFRSAAEYRPFAPEGADGYYLRYAGGPPRIVLSAEVSPQERALLAHELTHHFLAGVLQRQPRWLAEGLAVYMEALGGDGRDGAVTVGAPPPARLERARAARVPARRLLAWTGGPAGERQLDEYAASWLLVHWLIHRRPEAFADLRRRLAAGEPPEDAWRDALPAFDPRSDRAMAALDEELAAHARAPGAAHRRRVAVPAAVGSFEQPMPVGEVHAVRLALWHLGPPRPRAALEAEVDEALAESPDHPVALQVLAALRGGDPLPLARRAAAAHPDDPRAWTFLAGALRGEAAAAEREAAYRRAADLAPGNPAALHNLAQELLARGRSGEALPAARLAAQLAPWSPPLLAGYAAVLSDLGRCGEALALQRRAIDALPERNAAEARRDLLAGLEQYAAQCRLARDARQQAGAR